MRRIRRRTRFPFTALVPQVPSHLADAVVRGFQKLPLMVCKANHCRPMACRPTTSGRGSSRSHPADRIGMTSGRSTAGGIAPQSTAWGGSVRSCPASLTDLGLELSGRNHRPQPALRSWHAVREPCLSRPPQPCRLAQRFRRHLPEATVSIDGSSSGPPSVVASSDTLRSVAFTLNGLQRHNGLAQTNALGYPSLRITSV
jgi:hypothetical protein